MKLPRAVAMLYSVTLLQGADVIPAVKADEHIGMFATVCGTVVDSLYFETGGLLLFDKLYPDYTFSVFVPDDLSVQSRRAARDYVNKSVCVTGQIAGKRGNSEIVLNSAAQITLTSMGRRRGKAGKASRRS